MSGKNIIFEKSGKMILDHADCRYLWFFASLNVEKHANLQLPLNVQKLEVFQLCPLPLCPGLLLLAYCSINTISLPCDIVYHFWHLSDRVIVSIRSEKLSFHDCKGQPWILLQKTCGNPDLKWSQNLLIDACVKQPRVLYAVSQKQLKTSHRALVYNFTKYRLYFLILFEAQLCKKCLFWHFCHNSCCITHISL